MYTVKEYLEEAYELMRTPIYIANRCNERKTIGTHCDICAAICPKGVFPTGKRKHPSWEQCIKCGMCAASCPANCITPPEDRVNNFIMALARKGDFSIGCELDEENSRLNVRCLAAVSWEQLAYAALEKGVTISLRPCQNCENELAYGIIKENLKKLRFFLGDELYESRVKVLSSKDEHEPVEAISRRDLLNFIGSFAIDKAFTMMPEIKDIRDNGLFYRAMLRDAVEKYVKENADKKVRFGIYLPRFAEECYDCGYCQKSCPNNALEMVRGENKFAVVVDIWKCTSCGQCRDTCRYNGIIDMVPMKVPHIGRVAIAKLQNHLCSACGKPYPKNKEGSQCENCDRKDRIEAGRQRLAADKAAREKAEAERKAAEAAAAAAEQKAAENAES